MPSRSRGRLDACGGRAGAYPARRPAGWHANAYRDRAASQHEGGPRAEKLDLIVIGRGAGGSTAASRCRTAGWRVAVLDDLPYGGTCELRGCDPKKVLVGAAELADWNRRMQGRGMI